MKKTSNMFFNNGEINKQLLITSISIILTVVLVISTSLAAFTWDEESTVNNSIASGSIGVSITNTKGTLTMESAYPINTTDAISSEDTYTFTVSNTTTNPVYYSIKLINDEEAIKLDECSNNQINNDYIKWYIGENNSNMVSSISYNNEIVSESYLAGGSTKTFNLKIWIADDAPNDTIGAHFHGKIVLDYKQAEGYTKLSDKIKKDNPVINTEPDFSKVAVSQEYYNTLTESTTIKQSEAVVENGLYSNVDDDGETYYFRGSITNNYVKIGDMETLWRIVRINGDGSIRLMLNKSLDNIYFNNNSDDEKYVGYTYNNSSANIQDGTYSAMRTYLENWYNENMSNYNDLIIRTKFCNDTSISTINSSNQITYYPFKRVVTDISPKFKCPETTKTYGGEYNLKIGFITVDELAFAGGKENIENNSYFMNNGTQYWTGSPYMEYDGKIGLFNVNEKGKYNYEKSSENTYVRALPVINLKPSTLYTSGDGTSSSPYVVGVNE